MHSPCAWKCFAVVLVAVSIMGVSSLAADKPRTIRKVSEIEPAAPAEPQELAPAPPALPAYGYGGGYGGNTAANQPASGLGWRKHAPLEYYSRPPAPTYRWFTTGRGCWYDCGIKYGVGYPQLPTAGYPQLQAYRNKP